MPKTQSAGAPQPHALPHTVRGRKGPPLVLVHGFGADRTTFAALMEPLSRLRRTVAVDLPGHGEAFPWSTPPDAGVCAKALATTLAALDLTDATLVGHSLGGAVSALVALREPERVGRLVLLAPGGFGPEMNVRLLARFAAAQDEREMTLVLEQFFGPQQAVPERLATTAAAVRADPQRAEALRAIAARISRDGGQGVLPLDALAALPAPTTLVWGDADHVLPVRQAIAAPAAMARHILPGIGHMPHLEAPELVLDIIARAVTGRGLA